MSSTPTHDTLGDRPSAVADSSPIEVFGTIVYKRRKLLTVGWLALLVVFIVLAVCAKKRYTSQVTVQINPESGMSMGALAEGLKMLDPGSGANKGLGTVLAIMDSRKFAVSMIEAFHLKNTYHTTWDHLAIKRFQKDFVYKTFDEGIVTISFTYPQPDTCKIILDSILGYINSKTVEFSTSKARQEFAFNSRQVDSVYRRIDSIQLEAVAYLRRNNIIDVAGNMEVLFRSYGQIQNAIVQLESQYAIAKIDNRVPLQEKQNLQAQLQALKQKRRELLAGSPTGGRARGKDYDLSISYDSMPAMAAWQEKMKLLEERDRAILKILVPKLEESRLKMVETTPVINVIDPSFVPGYKSGPKRIFIILVGTFVSGMLFTLFLLIFDAFRDPQIDPGGLKTYLKHVRARR